MSERINTFFTAIKQGDVVTVARLLDESTVLLQAVDSSSGLSPTMTAAYHQQPQVIDLLVERGVTLNLFEACAAGNTERVRTLLGIDTGQVNAFALDGFHPLGLASYFGHHEVVELLLAAGAEVNTPSRNTLHVQPINSAAAGGHIEIARRLLEQGAEPNARQSEDFTPLHSAAQNGQLEMVRLLLQHGADPGAQANGKTPLDLAREQGHTEIVSLLSQA
jgi:uncharacterized protein